MRSKIKDCWELLYYAQVVSMLEYVAGSGEAYCRVQPEEAKSIADALVKYSYMSLYVYTQGSGLSVDTPVNVTLFGYELGTIGILWGCMLSGGMPGFTPPFDLDIYTAIRS